MVFLHKISKEQENEAGTGFVLFSPSRTMIGQFMKTYLNGPTKIPQFFTCRRIEKCLMPSCFKLLLFVL